MNAETLEKIYGIWDELSDFDACQSEEAVAYLMASLCDLCGAWNATWGGAIRLDEDREHDPLQGWRVAAVTSLHPVDPYPSAQHFKEILRLWERREMDPSFLLPMRDVGKFRTYSFRCELPPEWFETSFYKDRYGAVGICDSAFIGFPLNDDAEIHFGFYSRNVFTDEEVALLAYVLRGIKWFHRRLMLSRGLLVASSPLTPTEHRVQQLLLTKASEKQIAEQLGIAVSTAHQHVASIFRKFSVRSRAGLMSLWLNRQV